MPRIKKLRSNTQYRAENWLRSQCWYLSRDFQTKHVDRGRWLDFIDQCGTVTHAIQELHAYNNRYAGLD